MTIWSVFSRVLHCAQILASHHHTASREITILSRLDENLHRLDRARDMLRSGFASDKTIEIVDYDFEEAVRTLRLAVLAGYPPSHRARLIEQAERLDHLLYFRSGIYRGDLSRVAASIGELDLVIRSLKSDRNELL